MWVGDLRACLEHVVPVVQRGTETFDAGMQSDHRSGHVVTDGIGVEAAVDFPTLVQQRAEPAWVGSDAGGG